MRISDWSSDVCSSDLQGALRRGAGERHREHREEREVDLVDRRLLGVFRKLRLRQVDLLAHVEQRLVRIEAGIEFQYHVGAAEELGRASGRERLCQYGSISGGACTLKQKIKQNK